MKTLVLSVLFLLSCFVSNAQFWNDLNKKVASDRAVADWFGYGSSISDNYAIVGALTEDEDTAGLNTMISAGSAYIFKKDSLGNWFQVQKIVASDRYPNDRFGTAIAMNDSIAVITALYNRTDENGLNVMTEAGAAYIFEKDSQGVWQEVQKIVSSDRAPYDRFGMSAALYGTTVIIGTNWEAEDVSGSNTLTEAGSAYIFERNAFGNWIQTQKIVASDREAQDHFGRSVDIYDSLILVGAYLEDHDEVGNNYLLNAGSAYIFKKGTTGIWTELQKITATDRFASDNFGISVSISGEFALIGAYTQDYNALGYNSVSNAGAAYIFEKDSNGNWFQHQKLVANDRNVQDVFGNVVDLSNNVAIVGAMYQDYDEWGNMYQSNTGAAYVHVRHHNGNWIQTQKIVAPDRQADDNFARQSLAINNLNVIFSAYMEDHDTLGQAYLDQAGSVYIASSGGVSGRVFNDFDLDCQVDTLEVGLVGRTCVIEPGNIVTQTNIYGYWFVDSLADGVYTLTVDTSGNWNSSCAATQVFTVDNANAITFVNPVGLFNTSPCSDPNVSILMPFRRPCFSNQYVYVQACNNILANGILDSAYVIVELDPRLTVDNASIPYTSLGNDVYQFDLGDIYPNQCIDFWISTTIDCNAVIGETMCLQANLFPVDTCALDTIPATPGLNVLPCLLPWDNSSLNVEAWCQNDSVFFSVTNTGSLGGGDMDCYSEIRIYIDGVLTLIDSVMLLGQETVIFSFPSNGATWHLEADQHPLHPGNSHPNETIEGCGNSANWTPDLVNEFPQDDADPIVDIHCDIFRSSYDPNDKTGYPYGIGVNNIVGPNTKIDYLIRFQNTGNDTAFTVVVRDTLDLDLDIFSVVPGAASHPYTFSMYGPRILEWRFDNILLPDSTTNEPSSHGFFSYTVEQNQDLADGTVISNNVGIYFDFNSPVITNTTIHTIGSEQFSPSWSEIVIDTVEVCGLYLMDGYVYDTPGTYWQVGSGMTTDTLYQFTLTFNGNSAATISEEACFFYLAPDSTTYITSGTYTAVIPNAAGCDSVITINLVVYQVETGITQTGNTLISDSIADSYQWIDCSNGFSLISGETNQTFEPLSLGSYAVIVTSNGCSDTTDCVLYDNSGLDTSDNQDLIIIPNPTDGSIIITFTASGFFNIDLMDATGKIILEFDQVISGTVIDLDKLAPGYYYLRVDNRILKLVKN